MLVCDLTPCVKARSIWYQRRESDEGCDRVSTIEMKVHLFGASSPTKLVIGLLRGPYG